MDRLNTTIHRSKAMAKAKKVVKTKTPRVPFDISQVPGINKEIRRLTREGNRITKKGTLALERAKSAKAQIKSGRVLLRQAARLSTRLKREFLKITRMAARLQEKYAEKATAKAE